MRFEVETESPVDTVDVTDRVAGGIPRGRNGTVTVFCRHTTAGVVVNEAEPRLLADIESFADALAPGAGWSHDEIDDNADAHLKSMLLGRSVTLPVMDGALDLGTYQSVLLVDCDGPRVRSLDVV
ncbi:secondary thiamine-phosphate synthase enzyme YjbQ [Halosegnis marinus]|uniref:Secondary thiamine-phosphate synthase enzyme YjbQ n=1 Tax=Halosegnis marinus TaxID=3034023 RepID=A0ABD5ZSG7_9EURY|nr:secondary thiamine-phosphate synthase enzyme YjbQ [Halosegnis sp. DT85]